MMRIFYIDWQQRWECDQTMNIGANARGERTVSTKQPQVTDFDLRWQLGFQWHRRGIELVFKSLDCFIKRLFHSLTIFLLLHVFVVWNFTRLITRLKIFFTLIWWGSTQFQCTYYLRRILISRPPRVISAFQTSLLFPSVCIILFRVVHWCIKIATSYFYHWLDILNRHVSTPIGAHR